MALIAPPFVIDKGQEQTFEMRQTVASGTTASIDRGVFTKKNGTNVAVTINGDGTTAQLFTGLAKAASNETTTVAGVVATYFPAPGLIYRGNAVALADTNTQAKIDALIHKRVTLNLTGTTWTVNTSVVADAATNGIVIVGGNPNTSEVLFTTTASITFIGNTTT